MYIAFILENQKMTSSFSLLTEEEENQNCHQYVEIIDELILYAFQKSWFEKFAPCSVGYEGDQKEKHDSNLHIEKAGDQSPVKAHDGFFSPAWSMSEEKCLPWYLAK